MNQEMFEAYVQEMRTVFEFLEFEPSRREAKLYLPPRLDDLPRSRRLTIEWYHDEEGNPGLRFAGKLEFDERSPPSRLRARRWIAYVLAVSFLPWREFEGYAKDIWLAAPDEKDFKEALIRWVVDDLRRAIDREQGAYDRETYEEALTSLKRMKREIKRLHDWAVRLIQEINFTEAQREMTVVRYQQALENLKDDSE